MSHDYHEGQRGYSPAQLLVDGCRECGYRAEPGVAIGHLDTGQFARAWERAAEWQQGRNAGNISGTEAAMLRALFAVQVQLEKRGFPIGEIPQAPAAVLAAMLAGGPPRDFGSTS